LAASAWAWVDKIVPQYDPALKKTIARVHMKLDKSVQPLAKGHHDNRGGSARLSGSSTSR